MGRRGVAAQRRVAAVSACARARRMVARAILAGAFCLTGWAVLAVVDAAPAAASERPAAEHRLNPTGIADVARDTAHRVTSKAHGLRAERPDRTAATEESRPSDRLRDGLAQHEERLDDSPVVERLRAAGDSLAERADTLPAPDGSVLPDLLPDGTLPQQPDDQGDEDADQPAEQQPGVDVVPLPVAAADGGQSMPVPVRAESRTTQERVTQRALDTEPEVPYAPLLPKQLGLPFTASTGSSSSTGSGAGSAPVASLGKAANATATNTPLILPRAPRGPTVSNDAVKPPISPD